MTANLAQCQTLVRKAVAAGANVRLSTIHSCLYLTPLGTVFTRSLGLHWLLGSRDNLIGTFGPRQ